jgi:hypothetical protein
MKAKENIENIRKNKDDDIFLNNDSYYIISIIDNKTREVNFFF